MNKYLIIFLLLASIKTKAQLNQIAQGNANTEYYQQGAYGAVLGFEFRSVFTDTLSANSYLSGALKNRPGFVIRCGNKLYMRSSDLTIWNEVTPPAQFNPIAGTNISLSGTYPNITFNSTSAGTVTSVSGTLNRITSTGGTTPVIDIDASYAGQTSITTLGTIGTGVWQGTAITDSYVSSSSNWNTAYNDRLKWDGGATGLTASTGRTSLGGTTVGQNFFTLTNPSAITFPRINADNTVSTLDAATFRSDIGAGTGSVTSVSGTLNRISSTGGANPVIDIDGAYIGQTSITTLGTIGTGTWNGSIVESIYGGTGINNGGRTLTINTNSGTINFSGSGKTLTVPDNASVTGTNTGDQNIFSSIPVSGQTTVTANSTATALTFIAGTNVTITTNNTTKEITFAASSGSSGLTFAQTSALMIIRY